ncbi:AMP-binding protein [Albimonas sp. CAU 1670]|uniref:AMP-binding protein n=1 Tax=Albimonas sp. CAU 1670 TaxID=3032599 RepID=UPI0023DADF65|nr:AMP-binding protein [Albimonas sp. CAU 1670]MDF2233135.1 AMP-binding protein [Albimonas sp. CAU 1670]
MNVFLDAMARHAAERPDSILLHDIARGTSLTRATMDAASDRLAAWLAAEGFGPGDVVLHLGGTGAPRLASNFGAAKAGCAFGAPDPAMPDPVVADVFRKTGAKLALVDDEAARVRFAPMIRTEILPPPEDADRAAIPRFERVALRDEDPVIVRFTSGSSGTPKCPMMDAVGMDAVLACTRAVQILTPEDRTLLTGSWWPNSYYALMAEGSTLTVCDFALLGPAGVAETLLAHKITFMRIFTAGYRALAATGLGPFPDLKVIAMAGEALRADDLRDFDRMSAPGAELRNIYASSESQVGSTYTHRHGDPIPETVPLGTVDIPGILRVLDASGAEVGEGQVGELVAHGAHLSVGWMGLPEETAACFDIPPGDPAARRWFSGDLGWRDAQGMLHPAGRKDDQVKIRGYNVRLTEVERAIATLPGVRDVAAVAPVGPGGVRRLAAFVIPSPGARPDPSELRRRLAEAYPGWMVPGRIRVVEDFPRTGPTRKVKRQAFPDPFAEPAETGGEGGPPQGPTESLVAEVWRETLGAGGFGREDDFFDIGGDSLQAKTMTLECEARLGVRVPLESLMLDGATVAAIAARLDAARAAGGSVEAAGGRLAALNRPDPRATRVIHAMHVGDGNLSDLLPLAHALEGRAEVIGVRPFTDAPPRRRMPAYGRDAAAAVIDESEARARATGVGGGAVDPAAPAVLVGFSFGSIVAAEAARAMVRAGQPAPRLVLMDPPAPWLDRLLAPRRLRRAARNEGMAGVTRLALPMLGMAGPGGRPAAASAALALARAPTPPSGQRTLLVVAVDDPSAEERQRAWQALLGPEAELLRLPGGHMDIVRPEGAPTLAAGICAWLDRLDGVKAPDAPEPRPDKASKPATREIA